MALVPAPSPKWKPDGRLCARSAGSGHPTVPAETPTVMALLVAMEIFEPAPAHTAPSIWPEGGAGAAPFGDLAPTGTKFPSFVPLADSGRSRHAFVRPPA
jgi:hypothetical protein